MEPAACSSCLGDGAACCTSEVEEGAEGAEVEGSEEEDGEGDEEVVAGKERPDECRTALGSLGEAPAGLHLEEAVGAGDEPAADTTRCSTCGSLQSLCTAGRGRGKRAGQPGLRRGKERGSQAARRSA